MELRINHKHTIAQPGQTLLQIVQTLGLDSDSIASKPIAAKIAGEVFTLNYVPVRIVDVLCDRPSMRRAMAASNGVIQLLTYNTPSGRDVYFRTAQFLIFLAIHQLWPKARAKMNCAIGSALFVEVFNTEQFSAEKLKAKIAELVEMDFPLIRRRILTKDAITAFREAGQEDKARLLSWRTEPHFDVYAYGDFLDYYYGELAPSTGYIKIWDILPAENGFIFLFPDDSNPDVVTSYQTMPRFLSVCTEGERWCELMECETVADLNGMVMSGKIRELIRVNEALHEKCYSQIADAVCQKGAKLVMLAGPSSSGKTTSANRLLTQLRVHGKKPILMSLDDYYVNRDTIQAGPDGKLDLEHINTIDSELFRNHVRMLLAGQEIELPYFNFLTGKREWRGRRISINKSSVIIVEGLHALNPVLQPEDIDENLIFKLYISPLIPLNLDDHNRIPTSYLRLLRRIVRDYKTRGASVQQTLSMWDSVRLGEKRWIYPYQESADIIFNSSTLYELAVLKRHIFPLLTAIEPEDDCYEKVRAIVKVLNYVQPTDVDDEIPPTSLVREFIGGNSYYK